MYSHVPFKSEICSAFREEEIPKSEEREREREKRERESERQKE
jgi:hypothetical protein